jgi:hypothetical protein
MSLSDTFFEWTEPLRNLQTSATKGIPSFEVYSNIKKVTHSCASLSNKVFIWIISLVQNHIEKVI